MAPPSHLQTQVCFFQKRPVTFNATENSSQLWCGWVKKVIKTIFADECKSETVTVGEF
jgi:hypothetical protein